MTKRHPDQNARGRKNVRADYSTRWLQGHVGQCTCIVGLLTAASALASISGIIAYGVIVTHSIWSFGWPWWIALPVSTAFFTFFYDHIGEHLLLSTARMRDGLALALFSVGRWCVCSARRLRAVSARRIAIFGLRLVIAGCAAMVVVVATCVGIIPDQPMMTVRDDPPPAPPLPPPAPPSVPVEPKIEPPLASPDTKSVPLPSPRRAREHRPHPHQVVRFPFNIRPRLSEDVAPSAYMRGKPLIKICLPPFLLIMSPEELRACGLLPLGDPPPPTTSRTAIY